MMNEPFKITLKCKPPMHTFLDDSVTCICGEHLKWNLRLMKPNMEEENNVSSPKAR